LSVEGLDRLRVASLGEWAAVRSVPTPPRIVDLSIVTPPPKIL
jgi:hypothetical protein